MTVQTVDDSDTIALSPAQRALLISLRRVLISAIKLIDTLLDK